jgi:hypothetical protein
MLPPAELKLTYWTLLGFPADFCHDGNSPDESRSTDFLSFFTDLFLHDLGVSPLHFVRRYFFNAVTDIPAMTEGIAYGPRSLAVEMVGGFHLKFGTGFDSSTDHFVGIVDVQMNRDGCATKRLRRPDSLFRVFIG